MIKFKDMHRLLNIPHVGIEYFNIGMITGLTEYLSNANELLSIILKLTSLISFSVFLLLNYPRIKVRLTQISRKKINKKREKQKE